MSTTAADLRWLSALFWQGALEEVAAHMAAHACSQNAACAALGYNSATISKKRARLIAGGLENLLDQRRTLSGRTPAVVLAEDERRRAQWHNLRKGSQRLALEACLAENAFSADTAAAVRHYLDRAATDRRPVSLPRALRRQVAVPAAVQARFRGQKHFEAVEASERRSLTFWDAARQCEVEAGPRDLYESDDESENEPFRFRDPATGEWRIGRQCLRTVSAVALRILGLTPLGREKDAYRDEDKLDHMLSVAEACGAPRVWRLEKGWETTALIGVDLGRALKDARYAGQRWGALPFQLDFVPRSRAKAAVEGSFNHSQRLAAHEFGVEIGRYRSEFEASQKLLRQAQDGQPAALAQFPELAASADFQAAVCARFNAEPKMRQALGRQMLVPDEMWFATAKRELAATERWRFLPVKVLATVTHGGVQISAPHYPLPFRFRVNGQGAYREGQGFLAHGYRVLCAFHPARPEEGCHLASAETGPLNTAGHRVGEFLCLAPFWVRVPNAVLGEGELPERFRGQAQKANAAVRREFREIAAAGARGARTSLAQDGHGRRAEVRVGLTPAAQMAPMAQISSADSGSAVSGSPGRDTLLVASARAVAGAPVPARGPETPAPDLAALSRAEAAAASEIF